MRRRDLLALLGGSMAWPSLAHAQGRPVAVIGFLNAGSAAGWTHLVAAFHTGLAETGYIEGQNVRIEYRWAEGKYERLSELAVDLMQRRVAIIVAGGGSVTEKFFISQRRI